MCASHGSRGRTLSLTWSNTQLLAGHFNHYCGDTSAGLAKQLTHKGTSPHTLVLYYLVFYLTIQSVERMETLRGELRKEHAKKEDQLRERVAEKEDHLREKFADKEDQLRKRMADREVQLREKLVEKDAHIKSRLKEISDLQQQLKVTPFIV